ncbi:MAG TPA: TA system VapC family ribonuclease toxin [Thermoanaerobaculia bacterium]|nr:TA system VapC family ribonuclease toxin [Thermoanaerobaculia bacterium]
MTYLLDLNLLIALAWPQHVHHGAALAWFRDNQASGWATCPLTESGFVRVSSNQRIIEQARTPQEAIALLRKITGLPHHVFWRDDVALSRSELIAPQKIVGHRQVTDAHLLAVALAHGGRIATFDRGLRELTPAGFDPGDVVCTIH